MLVSKASARQGWSRVALPEAVYFQEGPGIRRAQYRAAGTPFINIRSFDQARGHVRREEMKCIAAGEAANKYAHFLLHENDCVLSSSGTIGKVARIRPGDTPCLLNTGVIRLRPRDERLHDGFLYYFLRSASFQHQLARLAGGSVQKNIGPSHLKHTWIYLPPLGEQQEIAALLSALDQKIEHCYVLYDMLRQWMHCRFRMEWLSTKEEPKPLSRHYALAVGGDWGSDHASEDRLPAFCLRGVDLMHIAEGMAMEAPLRGVSPFSISRRRMSESDVLIAGSGAGLCGRSLWMGAELLERFAHPVIYSNFCKRVTADGAAEALYLDCLLQEMRSSGEMAEYIQGTSVPNLDARSLLQNKKIALPNGRRLKALEKALRPAYERIYSGEAAQLIALRDAATDHLIRPPDLSA